MYKISAATILLRQTSHFFLKVSLSLLRQDNNFKRAVRRQYNILSTHTAFPSTQSSNPTKHPMKYCSCDSCLWSASHYFFHLLHICYKKNSCRLVPSLLPWKLSIVQTPRLSPGCTTQRTSLIDTYPIHVLQPTTTLQHKNLAHYWPLNNTNHQ